MDKIRISAVKYANTFPFIYGLMESGFDKRVILEIDHPADCAAKLISGKVDIGLIPVAVLPILKEYHIISDYCIGANGNVRTVMLLSNCPFDHIKAINLDYRSRSSVNLVKVLAKNKWKKEFQWVNTSEGFDFVNTGKNDAVVLIGDQCFEFESSFRYKIDLALEWKEFSGLPFVFACWTANRVLDKVFLDDFNAVLGSGVKDIARVVEKFGQTGPIFGEDLKKYLTENIDYDFNFEKKRGLKLFLELMQSI
jgi:chorismate dehydratase